MSATRGGGAAPGHGATLPVAAIVLLGAAVAFGALLFGAPPRFSEPASGPAGLRAFLVALGPLAVVEAASALAAGLLVARECLRRGAPALPGGRAAALVRLPLLGLLVLALAALVPLPPAVLRVVAPHSAEVYAALTPAADTTLRPMSLWPHGTMRTVFLVVGMLAASSAAWTLARRDPRRAATGVLGFVLGLAVAESAYGMAETLLLGDSVLGFGKVSGRGSVTGTFVHRTAMAVWAGMGLAAGLGLSTHFARAGRRLLAAACACGAAVCAAAAALTLSRLGVGAAAAGALASGGALVVWLRADGRRRAASAFAAGGVALLVLAAAATAASPAFRERVSHFSTVRGVEDPRFAAWASTLELFARAPVLGTGLGSFGRAIHLVQSPDSPQELWFAHSDPLNLLSDGGVLGFLLGLAFVGLAAWLGRRSFRGPHGALAAGALGGAVVVLAAALGDFQTQFPVVAIPFAALLCLPAALADAGSEEPAPALPERAWLLPPRGLAAAALLAALAAAAVPAWFSLAAARDYREHGVAGATVAERLTARARATLAARPSEEDLRRAEAQLREAARRDPLLDEAHLWLAVAQLSLRREGEDVLRSLGRARVVSRGHAGVNLAVGAAYLDLVGTAPVPHGPAGDDAAAALREAGALEPQAFSRAWALARARGLAGEELAAVVPERPYALVVLAEHHAQEGRADAAQDALLRALRLAPWDPGVAARLAATYRDLGREAEGRRAFADAGAEWPR